eukprot:TRINITY_DN10178_c0_g1_i1.p1 TRINITY_DN10178_c0_g1~~TRINITY_DN10178_c0_g1_i1.p1  ORF type:complete len:2128 (-),score=369.26 TRINITY_DN10178_c0_g1_i1:91-6369(-)
MAAVAAEASEKHGVSPIHVVSDVDLNTFLWERATLLLQLAPDGNGTPEAHALALGRLARLCISSNLAREAIWRDIAVVKAVLTYAERRDVEELGARLQALGVLNGLASAPANKVAMWASPAIHDILIWGADVQTMPEPKPEKKTPWGITRLRRETWTRVEEAVRWKTRVRAAERKAFDQKVEFDSTVRQLQRTREEDLELARQARDREVSQLRRDLHHQAQAEEWKRKAEVDRVRRELMDAEEERRKADEIRRQESEKAMLLMADEVKRQERLREEAERQRIEKDRQAERKRIEQERRMEEQERRMAAHERQQAEQEKMREDQEKTRAEQEKRRAEQEKQRVEQERRRAEQQREEERQKEKRWAEEHEKHRVEQEKRLVQQEKRLVEQEKRREEQEKQRVEQEKERHEQEKKAAEQELQRINEERQRLDDERRAHEAAKKKKKGKKGKKDGKKTGKKAGKKGSAKAKGKATAKASSDIPADTTIVVPIVSAATSAEAAIVTAEKNAVKSVDTGVMDDTKKAVELSQAAIVADKEKTVENTAAATDDALKKPAFESATVTEEAVKQAFDSATVTEEAVKTNPIELSEAPVGANREKRFRDTQEQVRAEQMKPIELAEAPVGANREKRFRDTQEQVRAEQMKPIELAEAPVGANRERRFQKTEEAVARAQIKPIEVARAAVRANRERSLQDTDEAVAAVKMKPIELAEAAVQVAEIRLEEHVQPRQPTMFDSFEQKRSSCRVMPAEPTLAASPKPSIVPADINGIIQYWKRISKRTSAAEPVDCQEGRQRAPDPKEVERQKAVQMRLLLMWKRSRLTCLSTLGRLATAEEVKEQMWRDLEARRVLLIAAEAPDEIVDSQVRVLAIAALRDLSGAVMVRSEMWQTEELRQVLVDAMTLVPPPETTMITWPKLEDAYEHMPIEHEFAQTEDVRLRTVLLQSIVDARQHAAVALCNLANAEANGVTMWQNAPFRKALLMSLQYRNDGVEARVRDMRTLKCLAAQGPNKESIWHDPGFKHEILLGTTASTPEEAELKTIAVTILRSLTTSETLCQAIWSDSYARMAIAEAAACSHLPEVQLCGLDVLRRIGLSQKGNEMRVWADVRVREAVIATLADSTNSSEIRVLALDLLVIFSEGEKNQKAMWADSRLRAAVLDCVSVTSCGKSQSSQDSGLRSKVFGLLLRLSDPTINKAAMWYDARTRATLLTVLRTPVTTDDEWQALGLLWKLASHARNSREIWMSPARPLLLSYALSRGGGSAPKQAQELRALALAVLKNLADTDDITREAMWDDRDLRTALLVAAGENSSDALGARLNALQTLRGLAISPVLQEVMWKDLALREVLLCGMTAKLTSEISIRVSAVGALRRLLVFAARQGALVWRDTPYWNSLLEAAETPVPVVPPTVCESFTLHSTNVSRQAAPSAISTGVAGPRAVAADHGLGDYRNALGAETNLSPRCGEVEDTLRYTNASSVVNSLPEQQKQLVQKAVEQEQMWLHCEQQEELRIEALGAIADVVAVPTIRRQAWQDRCVPPSLRQQVFPKNFTAGLSALPSFCGLPAPPTAFAFSSTGASVDALGLDDTVAPTLTAASASESRREFPTEVYAGAAAGVASSTSIGNETHSGISGNRPVRNRFGTENSNAIPAAGSSDSLLGGRGQRSFYPSSSFKTLSELERDRRPTNTPLPPAPKRPVQPWTARFLEMSPEEISAEERAPWRIKLVAEQLIMQAAHGATMGSGSPKNVRCLCKVRGKPEDERETLILDHNSDNRPVWSEDIEIENFSLRDTLQLTLITDTSESAILGRARLRGSDALPRGFEGWVPVSDVAHELTSDGKGIAKGKAKARSKSVDVKRAGRLKDPRQVGSLRVWVVVLPDRSGAEEVTQVRREAIAFRQQRILSQPSRKLVASQVLEETCRRRGGELTEHFSYAAVHRVIRKDMQLLPELLSDEQVRDFCLEVDATRGGHIAWYELVEWAQRQDDVSSDKRFAALKRVEAALLGFGETEEPAAHASELTLLPPELRNPTEVTTGGTKVDTHPLAQDMAAGAAPAAQAKGPAVSVANVTPTKKSDIDVSTPESIVNADKLVTHPSPAHVATTSAAAV